MVRVGIILGLTALGLIAMFDEFFELPHKDESEWSRPDDRVGKAHRPQAADNASLF